MSLHIFSGLLLILLAVTHHVQSNPVISDPMQRHQDIARPAAVGELTSEGRENVMKLLTSLDPAHKDANGRIRSQIMRSRAGGKRADRRDDTELVEEILPEKEREMKDEPFAANPLKEKDAKKAKKQTGKKSNKRACFWKYCN